MSVYYYYYYSYTENAVLHITLVNGKWTVDLQQKLKQAGVWTTVYNMYNIYDVYNMKHGNSDKRVMNDSWHVPVMTQRYHEDWRWPRSITLRWLNKEVILLWQNDVVLRGDRERQKRQDNHRSETPTLSSAAPWWFSFKSTQHGVKSCCSLLSDLEYMPFYYCPFVVIVAKHDIIHKIGRTQHIRKPQ